ncbi:MAG: ATP synthase F1 subunit gamma [Candidatus Moranbacteria bacterium RIFCSPHIGHO2_01_FULL_54_31]|nr:MAG: ATP synthase F1 subunit gamma [Candidatus Moranbacteria bacterium RIFCSPHIGHO2_01_FULL_54_31]
MASARDIRRRIKGVKGTGKITRAMEMISAVKMRKAIGAVLAIRPYALSAIELLEQLSVATRGDEHPLLTERPVKTELYVVITSNRGLCGAFNTQVSKHLRKILAEDADRAARFITIGKKGEMAVRRFMAQSKGRGGEIVASFPDVLSTPTAESMRPIARVIIDEFERARADRVVMVYTNYVSMMVQEVKVRGLLPVALKDTKKALNEMSESVSEAKQKLSAEYIIEPSPKKVLWRMIPRLIEMELYHAVLESNASQESSRMLAMRNATDAAKDMVSDLTLAYNQLRQQKITQEIAELSAGMAAVQK